MTAGGVIVVNPQGRVDGPDGPPMLLRDVVHATIDQGCTAIVLDIASIMSIDSMLLAILVEAYTTATDRNATLKLSHVSKRVRQLFVVTKLDGIMTCIDSPPA